MIVLVHENHDKWPNVSPVQHFCSGFDHTNLVFFPWFKFLPKIWFNKVYFYNYEHVKCFVLKGHNVSPICGRLGIGHIFQTG